ncbi:MAG: hypothetical protein M5U09_19120 [Gammaproteobacteria bacterium]|nr:hypothetical protein [Gammaproteobacteria bacterium]
MACLVAGMLVFAWTIGTLAVGRYRLCVATWDLAIFDQACWLLSHGEGLFLTTRNMPIFEHHLNLWLLRWPWSTASRPARRRCWWSRPSPPRWPPSALRVGPAPDP